MTHCKKAKLNIPMCVACVLFCLTLFSFHLCGGLYARYTARGSASDSARVATFEITEESSTFFSSLAVETVPGKDEEKTIKVSNKSEVAVAYTVTVENTTRNVPYYFEVGGSEKERDICTVTYSLAPNTSADVTILAIWDKEDALQYMGMVDLISVTITAQQID